MRAAGGQKQTEADGAEANDPVETDSQAGLGRAAIYTVCDICDREASQRRETAHRHQVHMGAHPRGLPEGGLLPQALSDFDP